MLFGPVSFRSGAGSITALTGPSGSGKTTLMRALIGHLPGGTRATGLAEVAGHSVLEMNPDARQQFRRDCVGYVGQDPGSALNPLMRVRSLLDEVALDRRDYVLVETLELVGLSAAHLRRRPGELSGGQQRRVALARALVRRTPVLLLDEPLAGLHGALRTEIARLLTEIAAERSTAIVLSGHDTTVIHSIADTVVELPGAGLPAALPPIRSGAGAGDTTGDSLRKAAAPGVPEGGAPDASGSALARPDPLRGDTADERSAAPAVLAEPVVPISPDRGDVREVLLRASGLTAAIDGHEVLADIELELAAGEALAVVGPSGAGKTTLARVIAGLHRATAGELQLCGRALPLDPRKRTHPGANGIQLVTQNPLSALNPRRTVAQTLGRPLRRVGGVAKRELPQRITELLAAVDLPAELAHRYPRALSGGQRQRVALARALAAEPAVLICDEITSALDTATASAIMALLARVRADGTAVLLITHDLREVVEYCGHVLVLDHGRIVEAGDPAGTLGAATHPATRELLG